MILVKANATPASLGRTNGLAQFAQCLARAGAPALVSALYAVSVNSDALAGMGRHLWVLCMSALALLGWASSRRIGK
jgi:hypothetical protein